MPKRCTFVKNKIAIKLAHLGYMLTSQKHDTFRHNPSNFKQIEVDGEDFPAVSLACEYYSNRLGFDRCRIGQLRNWCKPEFG